MSWSAEKYRSFNVFSNTFVGFNLADVSLSDLGEEWNYDDSTLYGKLTNSVILLVNRYKIWCFRISFK